MKPLVVKELTKIFELREGNIFSKRKREIYAVRDVSFDVDNGEILGLLGPNGAGKTTLIKMLCTLIEPTKGEAYIKGYSITKEAQKVKQNLGVMLTGERALYWKLTGRENLEYFAALYHLDPSWTKSRIDELLELLGLKDRENTLVENYSTGMRIRLNFAKALLNDAPVLLFDEPTMSLDPQSSRLIRSLIKELRDKGKTIILTTHYMEEADQLSDKVAIINYGRIVALAKPSELKVKVNKSKVIEIEGRGFERLEELNIKGIMKVDYKDSLLKVYTEDSRELLPKLLEFLIGKGVQVSNIKLPEPSLEDVFIELTGRTLRD
ncbi:MAG: ABC transporter ATP-binding protein [Nitrososphaerales archaeon]